jgi:hypothetical protein
VRGYRPSFRLAVRTPEGIVSFEADINPRAKRGADLVDIAGKVRAISIECLAEGMAPISTIRETARVDALVTLILEARVDQQRLKAGPPRYFLAFALRDGTVVVRPYWSDVALLGRGILLPSTFRVALAQVGAFHRQCPTWPASGKAPAVGTLIVVLSSEHSWKSGTEGKLVTRRPRP